MEESLKPAPVRSTTVRKPAAKKAAPEARKKAAAQSPKGNAKAADTSKPAKPKKPKLVRDSFTIPKEEYEVLTALKQRSIALDHPCKKSELLRAGIMALAAMSDKRLLATVGTVPSIKTGRPKQA